MPYNNVYIYYGGWSRVGALVHWLRVPAWKVGDRGFEPRSGIQVSKKQNGSSLLTRENSILWGASVKSGELPPQTTGFEFQILCLEVSVISPSSVDSPGPVQPNVHKGLHGGLRVCMEAQTPFILFYFGGWSHANYMGAFQPLIECLKTYNNG